MDFDPRVSVDYALPRVVIVATPISLQDGFCAVGTESGVKFDDIDLTEKVPNMTQLIG